MPQDESLLEREHRLCWARIRLEHFTEEDWLQGFEFDKKSSIDPLRFHMRHTGIGFESLFSRRHVEHEGKRQAVSRFVSQEIIDSIASDPDVLLDQSKHDFEKLMAELFARMGFEVDLYRQSKDGGIDFLAVRTDTKDLVVYAVQCKHPDKPSHDKKPRSLPVATVREIYGVAKANDLHGAIAITSTKYSLDAKRFADLRAEEIQVAGGEDGLKWIRQYRWNEDE